MQTIQNQTPHLHQIVKINDVLKSTTLSRSSINRLMTEGKFPRPISLTGNQTMSGKQARGWLASDVNEWILRTFQSETDK